MPTKKHQPADNAAQPRSDRPSMPREYGIQGPKKGSGLIPWERVVPKIAAARNYWIGSTRPDGRPHAMPVWGVWVHELFLFSTSRSSRKGRNLAQQPAIVVHLESGDDVVILEGAVREVIDPVLLAAFAEAYKAKYQFPPDTADPKNVTYALHLQLAFAWLESDFPGGATRWQF